MRWRQLTRNANQVLKNKRPSIGAIQSPVKEWLEIDAELGIFDTNSIKSVSNWAIFTLFLLTKKIKIAETVSAKHLFTYFSVKNKATTVKRKTFVDELRRNESCFAKNSNGEYFLTPKRLDLANKILLGTA